MFTLDIRLTQKGDEIYGEVQINTEINGKPTEILEHTDSHLCKDQRELFVAIEVIKVDLAKKLIEISEVYPFITKEIEGWDMIVAKSKIGDTSLSRIKDETNVYSRMHSPDKFN